MSNAVFTLTLTVSQAYCWKRVLLDIFSRSQTFGVIPNLNYDGSGRLMFEYNSWKHKVFKLKMFAYKIH